MSIVLTKRKEAGIGQEALANAAGMSIFKLIRIERNKQQLRPKDAIALAKVLGCSPMDLLPELAKAMAAMEGATYV